MVSRTFQLLWVSIVCTLFFSASSAIGCTIKRETFSCKIFADFVRVFMIASYETLPFDEPQNISLAVSLRGKSDFLKKISQIHRGDDGVFFENLCHLPTKEIEFSESKNGMAWSIDCVGHDIATISIWKDFPRFKK